MVRNVQHAEPDKLMGLLLMLRIVKNSWFSCALVR